jgi:eukaryotic-like serine/threonine-protein kinase
MIGQTIAHYRITGKLGAGGMGVVYRATDLKLERTVALKFLPHDSTINDSEKDRLRREARAASSLDHANIGVIYGIEESADGQIFIVMGYYEGETLAQKIARGLLSVSESVDIAMQIASGLASAHARNIVHRDIKPSNIIVTHEKVVKIVDFGLARIAATVSATQSITTTGTLPYMAPEQILGEPIDQRSDVWALGVILVQMLTGSHPFLRPNTGAMTFAILNQPPTAIDAVIPLLQPVVLRALSKLPAHRYAGGREILGDLEAAKSQMSGTTPVADPPTATKAVDVRELEEIMANATTPRWTAPPATGPSTTGSAQGDAGLYPSTTATAGWGRGWLYAGIGALSLALVASAALLFSPALRLRLTDLFSTGEEKHIAVLPIDNVGDDPANAAVADGLMDSLTGKLSNLDETQRSLWVVPASVVRSHKITDPTAAFRDLGATMVVKGKLQRAGTAIQLSVDLIDAKGLREIGSATLENSGGDLAAVQNDAVTRLARMMHIRVSGETLKSSDGAAAPTAYEGYLKALGYVQRYDKPGNLDLAIAALENSVDADPRFALGYAELGEAYRLKNQVDPNPQWIAKASANLERATRLDNKLPITYVALGRMHSSLRKNDLALQEFQKALEINPRDADATIGMAETYEHMGRLQDAEENFTRAARLRPDYWDGYNNLGAFYERQGRYADAVAQYRHVIELTPDNATAYSNLGVVYLNLGDPKSLTEAEAALKKSIQLTPSYGAFANLGLLYFLQKRYADSAETTAQALKINDKDWRVWDNLLQPYLWLGQKEKAEAAKQNATKLLAEFLVQHPQDADALAQSAIFYAQDHLRDKALNELNGALVLSPNDSDVLMCAAEVYESLGDHARALEYAHKSLSNGGTLDDLRNRYVLRELASDASFQGPGK